MLDDFKAKQAAKLAGEVAAGGGVGGTLGDEIKALQASILLKQSPLCTPAEWQPHVRRIASLFF